ncbi:hypothetical protein OC834_000004 [Tilletia horrida]|nr:hypothetical protein OC834_000004 [Tilletia horrida]
MVTLDLAGKIIVKILEQASDRVFAMVTPVDYDEVSSTVRQVLDSNNAEVEGDVDITRANTAMAIAPPQDWRKALIDIWDHPRYQFGSFIERRAPVGIRFFDQRIRPNIVVRSNDNFIRAFNEASMGVLTGLNWSNIVSAGGFVLSCLTCRPLTRRRLFRPSDLDLFVYGLNAQEATKKLLHVQDTLQANIRKFQDVYEVVRTSGTVTFKPRDWESAYPTVQVVLRIGNNPAEIIASFDLDAVAICYDGARVRMEGRAERALETGYSVATDKLLKITSPQRLLKYAYRGFGLVFRPGTTTSEDIKTLSMRASDAFDWVCRTFSQRRKYNDVWVPPHRTTTNNNLVADAYNRTRGRWLESYGSFVLLAAVWDHALMVAPSRVVTLWKTNNQDPYVMQNAPTSFTYRTTTGPSCTSDAEEAVCNAARIEEIEFISDQGFDLVTKHKGPTVQQVIAEPLVMIVILPEGFRRSIYVSLTRCAHAGVLSPLYRAPSLTDADGHKFEVCVWRITQDTMWQAPEGQDRFVFDFLRGATNLSSWVLDRINAGAPWLKLRYGHALGRMIDNSHFIQDADEQAMRMASWLRL